MEGWRYHGEGSKLGAHPQAVGVIFCCTPTEGSDSGVIDDTSVEAGDAGSVLDDALLNVGVDLSSCTAVSEFA